MFEKKIFGTFELMTTRFVEAIVSPLVQEFVTAVRQNQCNMLELYNNKKQFPNFSSALYATDVKFHHTNRPHGNQMERKLYYIGKHHLYGYKIKVFASPLAYAIFANKPYPGSVADDSIFRKKMTNRLFCTTKKTMNETYLMSMKPGGVTHTGGVFYKE